MCLKFWDVVNGSPVKLKMEKGQSLKHRKFERTFEGYNYTSEVWTLEDNELVYTILSKGRDCDGELSTLDSFICKLDEITNGNIDKCDNTVTYPKWEKVHSSQRDQYAKIMGY